MKNISLAAVICLLSGSTVLAADALYQTTPASAPESAVFDWSGVYAGVQTGYGFQDAEINVAPGFAIGSDTNGALLGAFAGFNLQHGAWVYGIEGDISYNWNEEKNTLLAPPLKIRSDWAGAARARVGYTTGRALLFAAGGVAITRGSVEVPGFFKDDKTYTGWTLGGGVDFAFTDTIFGRAEYRYSDFGKESIGGLIPLELDQHTVRIGLGIKF